MLESFSTQAIKIIEDAKIIASSLNSKVVGSEHLLLSLYKTKDSICRFLLQEKNISYDDLINTLNSITVIHKYEDTKTTFTNEFENIIKNAESLIKDIGSNYVFDEHLFYSMLEEPSNVGVEILILLGLNIDEVMEDIEDIYNFYLEDKDDPYPYLTNLSKKEILHPYIVRDNYIERINYILDKKQKNNPLLVGSAGVGKTAIIEGLAKMRSNDIIYELSLGATISGTKYRGELEEKLLKAIEYVKKEKAILFIDEIHNVVGAGSNDGSLDIANILKPYLSRNDVSIIGATTTEEYYKFIDKDKALMRRFQPIFITEPTLDEAKMILKGIKASYEIYHNIKISDELIEEIIDKSNIYIPNRTFPDKAIDILDEIGARIKYDKYKNLSISDVVDEIIKDLTNIKVIDKSILREVKLNYNSLKIHYIKFINRIKKYPNIFTIEVVENFKPKYLLEDLNKVFNFKNEMYLEIDLESYIDQTMINNLLGSSKGYVGYEEGGILSSHILKYPISLVYFKNFNKAHFMIRKRLEKIMKSSYIVDNKGRKINLQNTMFIYDVINNNKELGFIESTNNINKNYLNNIVRDESKEKYIKLLGKHKIYISNINSINLDILEDVTYQLILDGEGTYYVVDKTVYFKESKELVS